MQPHELTPLVEALLFASNRPLTPQALAKAIADDAVTAADVRQTLDVMTEAYEAQPRGFQLARMGQGYQLLSHARYAPWVESLLAGKRKARLSRAALETAAVIAYKQPIHRLEVERIRGVDAGGVLNTLLERGLITIKGRDDGPGRALLYGTTQEFLEYFGLSKLSDLPRLDEIATLAKPETVTLWDEDERARFEKHGVDSEELPSPEEFLTGTEDVESVEAAGAGDEAVEPEPGDVQAADQEAFLDVAEEVAEETLADAPTENASRNP